MLRAQGFALAEDSRPGQAVGLSRTPGRQREPVWAALSHPEPLEKSAEAAGARPMAPPCPPPPALPRSASLEGKCHLPRAP